jgi:dynein heavy chain
MTKSFGVPEWKDHLRILLRKAGAEGKQMVFLFSDTQVADESFLEDINLLLNTGDIPNLYGQDDKIAILDDVRKIVEKQVITANCCDISYYFNIIIISG